MSTDFPINWAATTIIPVNNIGTTGAQIIGVNGRRVGLRFHIPGTITCYVYSLLTNPAPTLSVLGGSYIIFPQNDITLYGGNVMIQHAVNSAWASFSASGSNNPLTIMEFTGP